MISWVRPQLLIPVHGEALHLHEHAKLARACRVPKTMIGKAGDPARPAPGVRTGGRSGGDRPAG